MSISALKWIGGKSKHSHQYLSRIPNHKIFVSPFCGACHIELVKEKSQVEIINDIDDRLINFLCVAQKNPIDLAELCSRLPYSETLYNKFKQEGKHKESLQDAAMFLYMNTAGYNAGGNKYKTGFSTSKTINKAEQYQNKILKIQNMSDRIKNWQILNRDFRKCFESYDSKDTFFFVDPPYFGKEYLYNGNFSEQDHKDLAEILNSVTGKVMLCYYPDENIEKYYKGWNMYSFEVTSHMKHGDIGTLPKKTELILTNYSIDYLDNQMSLEI